VRTAGERTSLLRKIPAVNTLLDRPEVQALTSRYSREFVTDLVREAVDELRSAVAAGEAREGDVDGFAEGLMRRLESAISHRFSRRKTLVLNASGVIVHTNLGRSIFSKEAAARMLAAAVGYGDLEYNIEKGGRGSRQEHIESLLARLFPGRRGLAVNNNAGAVMLALNTLAEGKEVLISRGELVEIGGSFRIPDVMSKSGAILHEVGTTNRTRLADFEKALSDRTGLLLKVHTSNYRIIGFTEETPVQSLASLARKAGVPLLVDQGSGCLIDLSSYGLKDEPTVGALLDAGGDVVTFSGDKLLGGPQAGILVGTGDLIARMKSNALYRALRPDKTTVAALEATLESFVAGDPINEIPTLRMLSRPADVIRKRSEAMAAGLDLLAAGRVESRIEEGVSRVGGGSAPMEDIPTFLLALRPREGGAEAYELSLRRGRPPVVSRVRDGWALLDLRTILEEQEEVLLGSLIAALP